MPAPQGERDQHTIEAALAITAGTKPLQTITSSQPQRLTRGLAVVIPQLSPCRGALAAGCSVSNGTQCRTMTSVLQQRERNEPRTEKQSGWVWEECFGRQRHAKGNAAWTEST